MSLTEAVCGDLEESAYSQSRIAFKDNDGEPEEFMCDNEECEDYEEMWNTTFCPTCRKGCVSEDGHRMGDEGSDDDDDLEADVVIIRF